MPPILPMKATAGELPAGDDWWFELKWDGMRLVVTVDRGEVRLTSANGKDATASYPELAGLGRALGVDTAVLDGEVIAFDDHGRPDFGRLQRRMHVTNVRQAAQKAAEVPVVLALFDLLALDGRSLVDVPLEDRRRLLESLVEPGPHWQVPAVHTDGAALLAAADAQGLEGVIAKKRRSIYLPGGRTREWVKVKIRRRQEFVVGGWAPGEGGRSSSIGGLLVGAHDGVGGALRYAGRVGSGLTEAERELLLERFTSTVVDDCPFDPPPPRLHAAGAVWVQPELVVEVAFAEWTGERRLRHPSYAGRRTDKQAADVTLDP